MYAKCRSSLELGVDAHTNGLVFFSLTMHLIRVSTAAMPARQFGQPRGRRKQVSQIGSVAQLVRAHP